MEPARVVNANASLFEVISEIVDSDYVLVKDTSNRISGIVTTSDLSVEFRILPEPFLLLSETENHVRTLIERAGLSGKQLNAFRQENKTRLVSKLSNLDSVTMFVFSKMRTCGREWD